MVPHYPPDKHLYHLPSSLRRSWYCQWLLCTLYCTRPGKQLERLLHVIRKVLTLLTKECPSRLSSTFAHALGQTQTPEDILDLHVCV